MEGGEGSGLMDKPASQWTVQRASIGSMYLSVLSVGLVCSLAIVTVYEVTRPIIRRNRTAFRQRSVLDVLPGSHSSVAFRQDEDGAFRPVLDGEEHNDLVFAGYDPQGLLVGIAIEARGKGYQDVIELIYGYSFETQAIMAIEVLQSRETPGLGDRVETDRNFQANFGDLHVRLNETADAIANPIQMVTAGNKTNPWEIDGISGATVTSRAIADMLRDSSQYWMPRLFPRQADFKSPQTVDRLDAHPTVSSS
jgi:Na+-translocating ferredoxin:NAD+ oxidoreductase subunit G